ncbi:MAG: carboxypeptidase-like regulatory domain-containing protein [Bacteroidetes bacterium]|nr:carboxypeptidase-like regulatory domain-containing protein [Bacteroidota bacterium]
MINKKSLFLTVFAFFFLLPLITLSQRGNISGTIKDKSTKETVVGASIIIKGTTIGTTSDIDGNFKINNVNAGLVELEISFISYNKEIVEVQVEPGGNAKINVELEEFTFLLDMVTISAKRELDNERVLMMEQKNASGITLQIGAQELSRKGVSDVATAVTKVTGVSKQEGSNRIYVRGLGDRYLSTTLNGLPIPSNNPELKNIALDLFTTDIVEMVTIDKVYNEKISGDFAGGNIDIVSKNRNKENFIEFELGSNVNNNVFTTDEFLLQQGPDYFGFYSIASPTTISDFGFVNSMNPVAKNPIGAGFAATAGKVIPLKRKEINIFTTVNFSNDYSLKEGISKNVNASGYPSKDLTFSTGSYNTNTTAMLNAGYEINAFDRISYNLIFINSSNQQNEDYMGTILDIADYGNGRLIRSTYEKNTLLINQLLGVHKISESTNLKWGTSYNTISSDMPDRIQNTFRSEGDSVYFGQNQITDNHRYFHYLNESEIAGNIALEYSLNKKAEDKSNGKISIGAFIRSKNRDFNSIQYNFRIAGTNRNKPVDPYNLDLFFNQQNLDEGYFTIETFRGNYQVPNVLKPQEYSGTQNIFGGFSSLEYKLTPKFIAIVGLRAEYIYQEVKWNTQIDPLDRRDAFERIEFLPVVTTKYEVTQKQNLRFAANKSYTLPQFKERAFFIYEEVTQVKIGNPDLYPSENYNADLKWEYFPTLGEVFSVTAFGKYILNPINEVTISSATNDISFLNTGDWGYAMGLEFEAKKDIIKFNNSSIIGGLNFTYMITEQELNSEKVKEETRYIVSFTHETASFAGAADYLLNGDITYKYSWKNGLNNIMSTITYQHTSDKIYAIGTDSRGNIIDKGFGLLNFIIKTEFSNKFGIGISVNNLLNPTIQKVQANECNDIVVYSYQKGLFYSLKMNFRF